MSSLIIGRLTLGQPSSAVSELIGDPVGSTGATVVAAPRAPLQIQIALNTILTGATTLAGAQTLRRQLRSMLNNTPLKLQGFLYVVYQDDTELNGWLVPDPTTLASPDGTAFKGVGLWVGQSSNWWLAGRRRANKEARQLWMKDLTTGLYERDVLGLILSTDFQALVPLALTVLPHGMSSPINNVSGAAILVNALPTTREGAVNYVASGLVDLTTVSFERQEFSLNLGDVVAYDRRGQITAPSTGPDVLWEEVYGPDYQWNWISGGVNDAPVLDNGLVRVRYDAGVGVPGLRIDAWSGTAYVEQGKLTFARTSDTGATDDTWVAAGLYEYTPDRVVVWLNLRASTDQFSLERIYVIMQRGDFGVTVGCYPSPDSGGNPGAVNLVWATAVADTNDSLFMNASQATVPSAAGSGKAVSTAGSGTSQFSTTNIGGAWASSENWIAMLRYSATATLAQFQTNFQVVQSGLGNPGSVFSSAAYGSGRNALTSGSNPLGYTQMGVWFSPTQTQQVMEAETMTLGSGTANTVDANASNGRAATATRTSDLNVHATQASWPNSTKAWYRVFARVKTSASILNIYLKNNFGTGATVQTSSTSYVWVDLGEVITDGSTLEVHAWATSAATISVDRIEAVLTQNRLTAPIIWNGCRDRGQAALYDSRVLGAVVAR